MLNLTGIENLNVMNITGPGSVNNVSGNPAQNFNNIQIMQIQVSIVNIVFNNQTVNVNNIICTIIDSRAVDKQGQQLGSILQNGTVLDNEGNPQEQSSDTKQILDSLAKIGQNLAENVEHKVDVRKFTGIKVVINNEPHSVTNGVVVNQDGKAIGQVDPLTGDVKDINGNTVPQPQNVKRRLRIVSADVTRAASGNQSIGGSIPEGESSGDVFASRLVALVEDDASQGSLGDGLQSGLTLAFNQVLQALQALKLALAI